jgi:hypothetical protein
MIPKHWSKGKGNIGRKHWIADLYNSPSWASLNSFSTFTLQHYFLCQTKQELVSRVLLASTHESKGIILISNMGVPLFCYPERYDYENDDQ